MVNSDLTAAYVLYSANEASLAATPNAGYWSTSAGWTSIEHATLYSAEDSHSVALPKAFGSDAQWLAYSQLDCHSVLESCQAGDSLWWSDPCHGKGSGYYRVSQVCTEDGTFNADTEVLLLNAVGRKVTAKVHELSTQKPKNVYPVNVIVADCAITYGYAKSAVEALHVGAGAHPEAAVHVTLTPALAWELTATPKEPSPIANLALSVEAALAHFLAGIIDELEFQLSLRNALKATEASGG